jgi:hypothetical protein
MGKRKSAGGETSPTKDKMDVDGEESDSGDVRHLLSTNKDCG